MIKNSIFCIILIFVTISAVSAQSGRRIKYPIPGTTSSGTQPSSTEETAEEKKLNEPESVGYSESIGVQPLSISISRRRRDSQKKPVPAATPAAKTETTAEGDDEVLKIETNLISIPVSVATKNGNYVPSLSKGNFQVFEDGKEQEVAYFGSTDKPFTAILLLDVSGSTSLKIEQIQEGAIAFVNQLLPQDKVMVISFDSGVNTLIEYSSDKAAIEKAIRKIRFGGGTSLYDAVDFSLNRKLQKIEGKKAIVLFTDGVNTTSTRANYESTVADAVESEAAIYPIYLNTFLDAIGIGGGGGVMSTPPTLGIPGMGGGQQQIGAAKADYALARRYLQDLASASGGRVYKADNSVSSLSEAFEGIAEELRSQYEIGYYPAEGGKSGDTKRIKIRINRPNLIIRGRDSYVVK